LAATRGGGAVGVLNVALEEGFEQDAVVVVVNGEQVFDSSDVSTRMQIGLADSFEVPIEEEAAIVEVTVPSQGVTGRYETLVTDQMHVGVSLQEGEIVFRTSKEPFGYL
jgi:hypothetical protein